VLRIPGFVDIQCNGYKGVDFSSLALTAETLAEACIGLLDDGGCACIVPTVITSSDAVYAHVLPLLADFIEGVGKGGEGGTGEKGGKGGVGGAGGGSRGEEGESEGDGLYVGTDLGGGEGDGIRAKGQNTAWRARLKGRILGVHLEGPFISAERGARGCHPAQHVVEPCVNKLENWQRLARGHIKLVTLAAEAPGADVVCRWAVDRGIAVALGHQMAGLAPGTEGDIPRLVDAGASLVTHLGNGLPNMIHRHTNPLWPLLADDRVSAMVITDGFHLPDACITTFVRAKEPCRIIVTSDCAPVAGLPDGTYAALGGRVRVEGNRVSPAEDDSCLAGSGSLMVACMNHLAGIGGGRRREGEGEVGENGANGSVLPLLSLRELEEVGFYNPLRAIGVTPHRVLLSCDEPVLRWEEGLFVAVRAS
jgi:N-acetylglucosamine-6-phosphate deacetylase